MKTTWLVLCLLLTGCTVMRTIEPSSLPIEVTHVSHLTQHFGRDPTNYGYDAVSVGAKWRVSNLSLTVSEGVVLEPRQTWTFSDTGQQVELHSGLVGPREVFTGRITYDIPLK